jgi:hypothetical protein
LLEGGALRIVRHGVITEAQIDAVLEKFAAQTPPAQTLPAQTPEPTAPPEAAEPAP